MPQIVIELAGSGSTIYGSKRDTYIFPIKLKRKEKEKKINNVRNLTKDERVTMSRRGIFRDKKQSREIAEDSKACKLLLL